MSERQEEQGKREFLILIYAIFVSMLGTGIVLPLLPFFGQAFQASPWQIMALFSCFSLGTMFGEPFWGRLSDRVGRKPVLLVTSFAYAVSFALLAFAPSMTAALVLRFVGGLASANSAVVQSIISDVTPRSLLTKRISKYWVSFQLGLMIGPVMGGVLAVPTAGPNGFRDPLLFAAALSFLSTAGILFFVKESRSREGDPRAAADPVSITASARSRQVIVLLIIQTFIVGVAYRGIDAMFALWVQHHAQWRPIDVGVCIAIASCAATACQLTLLPYLGQKLGETIALVAVLSASAIFLLVIPYGSSFQSIIAFVTGYTVCASFSSPYTAALIIRATKLELAGKVIGFNNSAAAFARVTGPFLAAYAYERFDTNSPFYLAAVLILPGVLLILVAMQRTRI
jgi:DHA1 family tetracycline resistance protein-like MFS transporter